MDDNAKRWLSFWIVALLIVMVFAPKPKPKSPGTDRETAPTSGPTTRPGGGEPAPREAGVSPESAAAAGDAGAPAEREKGEEVAVETDTCRVVFSTAGAYPVRWEIIDPAFAKATRDDIEQALEARREPPTMGAFLPIEIIPDFEGIDPLRDYPMMVVLKERDGPFHHGFNSRVYPEVTPSEEADGTKVLAFTSPVTSAGLRMTKTFRVPPKSYLTELTVRVENVQREGAQNLAFSDPKWPGLGLMWGPGIGQTHVRDRWGASLYSLAGYDGQKIVGERFGKAEKALPLHLGGSAALLDLSLPGMQKWAALDSRFYMAAIIPEEGAPLVRGSIKRKHVPPFSDGILRDRDWAQYRDRMAPPITMEVYSGDFLLRPGESKEFRYTLFVGPKKRSLLAAIDEKRDDNLRYVLFHDSMWLIRVLAVFMLQLLNWFHDLTGNYGVAIILVVLVMRLLTQPLTHLGIKSQAQMMVQQQRLKPFIDAVNAKYKDDPQKRNAEVWKVYREHGVNPLGTLKGCLWMLIQLPIFFALYRLLSGAIDLRGAGFLWIDDLTAEDALFTLPFYIPFLGHKAIGITHVNLFPILMGVSQVLAQRLQTTTIEDPTQKQMMMMMPIMFIFLLYRFPAGLSLYWFISNLWQIAFQGFVNKKVKADAERKAHEAFEERKRAGHAAPILQKASRTPKKGKPGWQERMMAYLEAKSKDTEKTGK
ncbi:MAG TPA: YidC/Oxa1 family insertase periplasmic-domain containing protein [Sumerlaeia bacterium]|nr:YidC/Oxa1 family insertase periplasmic-domain containing protein [Sumerlaeia bacterium]